MPPKKGKGTGKGAGKKAKQSGKKSVTNEEGVVIDKEALLKAEFGHLNHELESLKKNCDDLRDENEFLQTESEKIRSESHEYMSYIEKKTYKRQTTIVTLSDQNTREIQDIMELKAVMLAEYEEKKVALRQIMMDKETQLFKAKQDLTDLTDYKNLQQQQSERIKELESKVMEMRAVHTHNIQELKSQFLTEKAVYEEDSTAKLTAMIKQANSEAMRCLNEHTTQIKVENKELRAALLRLIRQTRALNEQKTELEEQRKILLKERLYAEDLRKIQKSKQQKAPNTYKLLDEPVSVVESDDEESRREEIDSQLIDDEKYSQQSGEVDLPRFPLDV